MTRNPRSVVVVVVALLLFVLSPTVVAMAQVDPSVTNSHFPGSLIVFPKFHRGAIGGLPATTFEIGVVCPDGTDAGTCFLPQGALVNLRLHWVCPAAVQKGEADFCQSQDFDLRTTVNGKLEFTADGRVTVGPFDLNGGVIPVPSCREGYLIAYVVDDVGDPIAFDGLIGEEVLRLRPGSASSYNGITFQAGTFFDECGDCQGPAFNGVPGALHFNNLVGGYKRAPAQFAADVRYEKLTAPTTLTFLTLLTLDIRQNSLNPNIVVPVNFYRANQVPLSTSIHFTCWREIRLTEINSNLTVAKMGTKGLMVATGPATIASPCDGIGCNNAGDPVTVLGIVTTLEDVPGNQREYGYAMYHVGEGVDTTFYTLPPF